MKTCSNHAMPVGAHSDHELHADEQQSDAAQPGAAAEEDEIGPQSSKPAKLIALENEEVHTQ